MRSAVGSDGDMENGVGDDLEARSLIVQVKGDAVGELLLSAGGCGERYGDAGDGEAEAGTKLGATAESGERVVGHKTPIGLAQGGPIEYPNTYTTKPFI